MRKLHQQVARFFQPYCRGRCLPGEGWLYFPGRAASDGPGFNANYFSAVNGGRRPWDGLGLESLRSSGATAGRCCREVL